MKYFSCLVLILSLLACKQDKAQKVDMPSAENTEAPTLENPATDSEQNWLYVNAENGLNVRDENGDVLYKYPNAKPLNIKGFTDDIIEVVDNGKTIKGRKAIIDYYAESGKVKGYVFEGYLTKIEDVEIYDSELCKYLEYIDDSGYSFSNPRCLDAVLKFELLPYSNTVPILNKESNLVNQDGIKKVNNIIELPTKGGSVKIESFPATTQNEKQELYEYLGELPIVNSYLISGEYFEGGSYMLYDKSTGKRSFELQSIPVFSPNGKIMVALGMNPYESLGEFEIANVVNRKITNKRHFSFVNWAIVKDGNIKWIDDNTFLVTVVHTGAYWNQREDGFNKKGQLLKVTIL